MWGGLKGTTHDTGATQGLAQGQSKTNTVHKHSKTNGHPHILSISKLDSPVSVHSMRHML